MAVLVAVLVAVLGNHSLLYRFNTYAQLDAR